MVSRMNSCMLISDLQPSDCAAWVQAIGSIAAIFVSAALVYFQLRMSSNREKRVKDQEHKARLESVFQLCSYSKQVTEKVIAEARVTNSFDESVLQSFLGELDAILTALKKYEATDFSDFEQLSPFIGALAQTNTARSILESAVSRCLRMSVTGYLSNSLTPLAEALRKSEEKLGMLVGGASQK